MTNGRRYKPLELEDPIPFGKHKCELVKHVVEDDPSYIEWMIDNTSVEFEEEVLDLMEKKDRAK